MKKLLIYLPLIILVVGCKKAQNDEDTQQKQYTEVSITSVGQRNIKQELDFRAETDYLHTTQITAPVTGFIKTIRIQPGEHVGRDGFLFSMISAEQHALNMNVTPTSVTASKPSIVTSVGPQAGSFVTEGSTICTLTDMSSLVFKIKIPTEYGKKIHTGTKCTIVLPDGSRISTTLSEPLMQIDGSDQTIDFVARIRNLSLPAGLVAKALINLSSVDSRKHQTLPIQAVQSDDNMTRFWVMRLKTDSTVEKVFVTTGYRDKSDVEIISPILSHKDRIVLNGAYGLTEDALVNVE